MPTLNWIGKEAVINHHDEVPIHTLTHDSDRSLGAENDPLGTGNLLIEGDNLIALKALLPYYAGKVKCIFIDPPYNTGNKDWMYNDNVNNPTIQKWLGKTVGKLSEDLSRHDKWLCMMYPRLCLLHQLLREDGVIFISIDDNEQHHLRMLMDEIFGENNFIATFLWKKKGTSTNTEGATVSPIADYQVCYRKSSLGSITPRVTLRETRKYPHQDEQGNYRMEIIEKKNTGSSERKTMRFQILGQYPREGKRWQIGKDTARKLEANNRFIIHNGLVKKKIYDFEDKDTTSAHPTYLPESCGSSESAEKDLTNILGDNEFETSKPLELVSYLLKLSSNSNDIILDSFAGSGTTGHAVLEQNQEDGGNRQFILVELEREIARKITAVRLERVSEGYTYEQKGRLQHVFGTGGTFSYYHVGETFSEKQEIPFSEMAQLLFFKETGTPMAVDTVVSLVEVDRPSYGACNADERYKRAFLGSADGVGVYLLNSDDILTEELIDHLPQHDGSKVIHCGGTRLTEATLKQLGITFRQMPYNLV